MTRNAILSFRGVGFGYANGLEDAVSHLDFDIPPASITAMVENPFASIHAAN
jgi:hypothetical protein